MNLEGQRIGRYYLSRLLGRGGIGEVYLAEDPRIEQQVAIKVVRTEDTPYPNSESSKEGANSFLREARAIARLDHPNILPMYDYGEEHLGEEHITYIVMPYRKEGSLAAWIQQHATKELLSLQDTAYFLRQAANALQHAHDRQIIHQDVKPPNFLLRSRKEDPRYPDLLLSDFGIARLYSATSSASVTIRGTPAYMAPEQWRSRPVFASDQYALAVMAYQLLTGRLPFHGGYEQIMFQHFYELPSLPSILNPRLSPDVNTVLLRALAKNAEDRFPSITEFSQAFQEASRKANLPTNPIAPPPPSGFESLPPTVMSGTASVQERTARASDPNPQRTIVSTSSTSDAVKPLLTPKSPGLPSIFVEAFIEASEALAKFFSRRGSRKQPETQLSLFAIARTTLEADDRAIVGKVYTVQAGVSQNRPADFRGEPFRLPMQNPAEPLLFGILLHPSENIELMGTQYQSLNYDPRNTEPQFISCPFRLKAPGRGYLVINFYRERQWLKTIRFEFDGIEQSVLSTAMRGR